MLSGCRLADLQRAALDVGEPMWGYSGPLDAGGYNSTPWEVPFFQLQVGAFASDYGRFFLVCLKGDVLHGSSCYGKD